MTTKVNRIERYYDSHDRDDEELSQSFFHQAAIKYLMAVLEWLFFGKQLNVGIATNVNFYLTDDPNEPGISPDIAVVDGLEIERRRPNESVSYYVGEDGPAPRLVIEICSRKTWRIDIFRKPGDYSQMGVAEYIAFDPHQPTVWTREWRQQGRLFGWRLDSSGNYQPISKREDGALWSEQLDSWLVVEDKFLRLYTADGELRVDQHEADEREKQAIRWEKEIALREWEVAKHEREAERQAKEVERQAKEAERQAKEAERQAKEAERQAKEAALMQLEEFKEKIRKLGYDPNNL